MREKRRERPRRCVGAPLYSGICACRSSIRFFSVGQKNFLRQRRRCAILLRRFVLGWGRRYAERCPSWPKEHDWKSCMPQKGIWGSNPHLSARLIPRASSRLALIWRPFAGASPLRRGGRVVECGGLENRFTGAPGDEGSNPSSSASYFARSANFRQGKEFPTALGFEPCEGTTAQWAVVGRAKRGLAGSPKAKTRRIPPPPPFDFKPLADFGDKLGKLVIFSRRLLPYNKGNSR